MIADVRYVETLWNRYLTAPATLPADWRNAFEFVQLYYGDPAVEEAPASREQLSGALSAYLRRFGHLHADLDPLGMTAPRPLPDWMRFGSPPDAMRKTYTGSLAVETGHLDSPEMFDWVTAAFEAAQAVETPPDRAVYRELLRTEIFEAFLATKYPGKKRFGSEGADAVLPLLHALRREAGSQGIDELVIGSMHRGRLSVLGNFMGMDLPRLFALIDGTHPFGTHSDQPADLAYHLGFAGESDGVKSTLLPNPSHLEAVNPVVMGYARARRVQGSGRAMAVILHTDASVIGQGVNAELLQMSALTGFEVGGTIHVIINNQIGFTTEPHEGRSARYCTAPWRAVESLILHVNGDDVDAALKAGRLALAFRARFARDAVIDLVCYRANGHNEIDEPRFTQPLYYHAADSKIGPPRLYERRVIEAGIVSEGEAAKLRRSIKAGLDAAFSERPAGIEAPPSSPPAANAAETVSEDALRQVVERLSQVPQGQGSPKLVKLMERRREEISGGITWPLAESMAFACALREGYSVRLCGQDVERGSFSQRHLAAINPHSGARVRALDQFGGNRAHLEVVNSLLSEYAVLGFEYGYSLTSARTLCIWEAQFGDFANGAQVMLDQFISSGFQKWGQRSALTMLLPHGLEGQGPEHSSARIERLLQLCARGNMVVAHPTTPANYFHLLLDQARHGAVPLAVLTPKVLLRHPLAKSKLAEFAAGAGFLPVLVPQVARAPARAVICSGKIAYEAEKECAASGADAAVVRLEQLYPFPADMLQSGLRALGVRELVWLQEEPENFGAGLWLTSRLSAVASALALTVHPMVARGESASPAGSFHTRHDRDQLALIRRALGKGA